MSSRSLTKTATRMVSLALALSPRALPDTRLTITLLIQARTEVTEVEVTLTEEEGTWEVTFKIHRVTLTLSKGGVLFSCFGLRSLST